MSEEQVALAAVAGAHGISGEVRLKLFAEGAGSLKRHSQVRVGDRILTLASVKDGRMPIVRFAEVADRSAAEALRGELLSVPRSALPPLDEGEYYHSDLIGLACEDRGGESLGTVAAVENFGAGDLLEIERPGGRRSMVPFREGIADLIDGRIVVDPDFLA
ncbi:MAG: ribosome maturation factor RimM [Allosphingosinicella sp.]